MGRPQEDSPGSGGGLDPPAPSEEGPVDLSDVSPVDSLVLVLFWALAGVVFLQFFTRYVLNDSVAWTEEIARYLLIGVGFIGSTVAVRKNTHIFIEFFYRYLPPRLGRALTGLVDLGCITFFAACAWLGGKLALKSPYQKMVSVELPKSVIYWTVAASFAVMAVYAVLLAWRRWRQGYSELTRRNHDRIVTD